MKTLLMCVVLLLGIISTHLQAQEVKSVVVDTTVIDARSFNLVVLYTLQAQQKLWPTTWKLANVDFNAYYTMIQKQAVLAATAAARAEKVVKSPAATKKEDTQQQ